MLACTRGEENGAMLPTDRLCKIMNVCPRGYHAYRPRPISRGQRKDMVLLAHIREQHRLSLNSYGRPRVTEELKELDLEVGHRRIGRLMYQNGIIVIRTRKYEVTADSNHKFNIEPNLLNREITALTSSQKWVVDISYIWKQEGWLYLAVVLGLHSRRVDGWAPSHRYCVLTAGQWSEIG